MLRRFSVALLGTLFASSLLAQGPCYDTNIGTDLNLGDDDVTSGLPLGFTFNFAGVAYTQICVCSNGYIWMGPTSVPFGDWSPTEAELLSGAPRICPMWIDFQANATGSGHIYFNTVAASGSNPAYATVTWAGVYEYGTTNPLTVQIKLDAGNNVSVYYGADTANATGGTASPGTAIIGASPGGGAASNLVSLAALPLNIGSNTFADVQALPGFAYGGANMDWVSLNPSPGYSVFNVPCIAPATFTRIGSGCPAPVEVSVYEQFDASSNPMDISNTSFQFLPNGSGGYLVVQPGGGSWFSGFTNNIGAGDDTTALVSLPFPFPSAGGLLNSIVVCSNGYIWLDPTNLNAELGGDTYSFLNDSPRIAGMFTDLNAAAGGAVFADFDSGTGEFVITWSGVPEFGYGGSNTFQIALQPSGGFEIRYQTVGFAASSFHQAIAGYSGGYPATDSPVDLSAVTVYDTGAASIPLDLSSTGNPTPQIGTTFTLTTSGIPSSSALGITILGNLPSNPALDLTGFGAPGCTGYVDVFNGLVITVFQLTGGSGSVSLSLPIPNSVSLAGLTLYAQGAATATSNSLGLIFSNGGKLVVGL